MGAPIRTWRSPNEPLTATLAERARSGTRPTTRPAAAAKPAAAKPKPTAQPKPQQEPAPAAPAKPLGSDRRLPDDVTVLRAWAAAGRMVELRVLDGDNVTAKLIDVARYSILIRPRGATEAEVMFKHALVGVRLATD